MGKKLELEGQRFGKLLVVEAVHNTEKRWWYWKCVCDCGGKSVVRGSALKNGNTTSCGCHKKSVLGISTTKHAMWGTRTYRIWKGMNTRCHNPNTPAYKNYGGRGITVCDRWRVFSNFLSDMGECPDGLTLDRINTNGNYTQKNCRWATYKQQGRNMRCNRIFSWRGSTRCLSEWAEIFKVDASTLLKQTHRKGVDAVMQYHADKKTPFGETITYEIGD